MWAWATYLRSHSKPSSSPTVFRSAAIDLALPVFTCGVVVEGVVDVKNARTNVSQSSNVGTARNTRCVYEWTCISTRWRDAETQMEEDCMQTIYTLLIRKREREKRYETLCVEGICFSYIKCCCAYRSLVAKSGHPNVCLFSDFATSMKVTIHNHWGYRNVDGFNTTCAYIPVVV